MMTPSYGSKFKSMVRAGIPVLLTAAGISGCAAHTPHESEPSRSTAGLFSNNKSSESSGGSSYHIRAFQEKTLPNGLKILFIPDETLPYITFSILLKSGSDQDPEGQAGLAALVAEVIDKGTVKRDATQIANDIGDLGTEFEASAGADFTMMTLAGLSYQADKLLENFSEILLQPAFSDVEIERARKQMISHVEKRIDNPEAFSRVAFEDYVYGNHPYGHPSFGTAKSLKTLKKKNVIQYYLRNYRPGNAILAVVGKYTPAFEERVATAFGGWQNREVTRIALPKVETPKGLQIRVVDKAGLTQAQIRLGGPGIKRQNPDFVAVRLANTILGGAFSSRLGDEIRIRQGLTYSISSEFDARQDTGPFEIETFTKNEAVGKTVSGTLKLLREFKEKGVTKDEVESAKGYLKGIFPNAIETPEKLAQNLMLLRLYGIPDNYLTNYLANIDHLTAAGVNQIIPKYFDDKNIKVLVYSTASEVVPQLKELMKGGEVEVKPAADYQ